MYHLSEMVTHHLNFDMSSLRTGIMAGALCPEALMRKVIDRMSLTELAIAYARGYADSYSLGLWSLGAEDKTELLPLLGELAWLPEFGYAPTPDEKNDAEKLGRAVLLEIARRAAHRSVHGYIVTVPSHHNNPEN